MTRSELEHILRAAGGISGVTEWVIVGSQAILGAVPDAPREITVSQEVDLYAPGDEAASDLIDGSIDKRSITVDRQFLDECAHQFLAQIFRARIQIEFQPLPA
jgi:hypothetical protein